MAAKRDRRQLAKARTKPAIGHVIQVPERIFSGERVRLNVDERRFSTRCTVLQGGNC